MQLIAITGSIGCGKTTLAKIVKGLGYMVFDIDGWVRRIYFQKDFIKVIAESFPGTVSNGQVNKRMIRDIVFSDHEKLAYLEGLIHPFLKETLKQVIRRNAGCRDLFFIDIALLFEMGWDKYCDFIIVADVDYEIQKQRVMKRDKVSADNFDSLKKAYVRSNAMCRAVLLYHHHSENNCTVFL